MSKEANECIECRNPAKGFKQTSKRETRDRSRKQYDAGIIIITPETGLFTVGLRVQFLEDQRLV